MDTVQVFIPTFNRRGMLEEAIDSVLGQTYPCIEVVVLDNASTDETQNFMKKLAGRDSRVKYKRTPSNVGMISNFNRIASLVSEAFFCVLTDDDVYEPHFLMTAMNLFEKYPSAAFVGTNAPIRQGGEIINVMLDGWEEGLHKKGTEVRECSQSKHPMFTHCIFRSSIAQEFIFHDSIRMAADGFLLTCLATKYDMAISKTVTGFWNMHGDNATLNQSRDPMVYLTHLTSCARLYDRFCRENCLKNQLAGHHKKKIFIGLLQVGRERDVFHRAIQREDVREFFNPIELYIVNALRALRFLDASLRLKANLRKIGVI